MALGVAGRAIARNKLRSALTMLGMFIGVAALIAMVAVGQGADRAVRAQIESLGTNLLIVVPGASVSGGVRGGFGSASTLTLRTCGARRVRRCERRLQIQQLARSSAAGTGTTVRDPELLQIWMRRRRAGLVEGTAGGAAVSIGRRCSQSPALRRSDRREIPGVASRSACSPRG
jgi:hypothetical protein